MAGTSCFGYSDLTIPSSLKSLAHAHSGGLVHQRDGKVGEVAGKIGNGVSKQRKEVIP